MNSNDISLLTEFFPQLAQALVRIKVDSEEQPTEWSRWLICPTEGYVEIEIYGPVSVKDVEWIEIKLT